MSLFDGFCLCHLLGALTGLVILSAYIAAARHIKQSLGGANRIHAILALSSLTLSSLMLPVLFAFFVPSLTVHAVAYGPLVLATCFLVTAGITCYGHRRLPEFYSMKEVNSFLIFGCAFLVASTTVKVTAM